MPEVILEPGGRKLDLGRVAIDEEQVSAFPAERQAQEREPLDRGAEEIRGPSAMEVPQPGKARPLERLLLLRDEVLTDEERDRHVSLARDHELRWNHPVVVRVGDRCHGCDRRGEEGSDGQARAVHETSIAWEGSGRGITVRVR